jgi:adenylate kinase
MIMDELAQPAAAGGAILDGFPRTEAQARALDDTLARQRERVTKAVFIDVATDELVERLSGRWVCPACGTPYHVRTDPPSRPGICDREGAALVQRNDDRPEVVRARLEKQVPPMREVVDHYQRARILETVDGSASIEAVRADLLARLA